MHDVAESGRTVLFVSHNMAAITQLCTSAIWLDRGELRAFGSTKDVIDAYAASYTVPAEGVFIGRVVGGDGSVELLSYRVLNEQGTAIPLPVTNEDVTITMRVRVKVPVARPALNISLWSANGLLMTSVNSVQAGMELEPWEPGERDVSIVLRSVPYLPGNYRADIWLMGPQGHIFAYVEDAIAFEIGQSPVYGTSHITPGFGSVYTNIDFQPPPGSAPSR